MIQLLLIPAAVYAGRMALAYQDAAPMFTLLDSPLVSIPFAAVLVLPIAWFAARLWPWPGAGTGVSRPWVPLLAAPLGVWWPATQILILRWRQMAPFFPGTSNLLFGLLPLSVVLLVRWRRAGERERRGWAAVSVLALLVQLGWSSTWDAELLLAAHTPFLEGLPAGPGRVGLLRYERAGWIPDMQGEVYEVVEITPNFERGGGIGLYRKSPGQRYPTVNQNIDQPLPFGWRWYVDD